MAKDNLEQALADEMVQNALRECAEAQFNGNIPQVLKEIQGGSCDVCGFVAGGLARQVGSSLGEKERGIKAVFRCEPDYSAARSVPGGGPSALRKGGIHLVGWAARKPPALQAQSSRLVEALTQRRRKILCANCTAACSVIDFQMVDDGEVQENRGLAVMVNSLFAQSTQVWRRPGANGHSEAQRLETVVKDVLALTAPGGPEVTPEEVLFSQAEAIEKLTGQERRAYEPRLQEIKVALIRRLLSEQPGYIEAASRCLSIADLAEVVRRRIGSGRIGGEAAGLVLAAAILRGELQEPLRSSVAIPESYYLGADLFYTFMAMNRLMRWNAQKYKPEEQIRSEYPLIREIFRSGDFPPETLHELSGLLHRIGKKPLIVRSSSLLEDSFGSAFAGKYEFVLCPNQSSAQENLEELVRAIASVYASTLCPEALLYRRIRGLRDYDERMGILIQPLQGERFGRYYLPAAAGVVLSRNLYRWSPHIRPEDGFVRLVWGLGTSAVERAGNNPPRLVALSHPTLQPGNSDHPEWSYCQQFVDVVDLEENRFKTLPVQEVITPLYPGLRLIAQRREGDFFTPLRGRVMQADIPQLAITFDEFLRRTTFAPMLTQVLRTLEKHFGAPVDLGFTAQILDPEEHQPQVHLSLLHCRRQEYLAGEKPAPLAADRPEERVLFRTSHMVPRGRITGIRHILFVRPEGYYAACASDPAACAELRLAIYQLNARLGDKQFICIGPGQWGAENPRLGVFISYADIYRAAALVELCGKDAGPHPDPALGTYAFQDLMEAHIYPLTVNLDQPDARLNRAFLDEAPDQLGKYLPSTPLLAQCLRLVEAPGALEIVMDDERGLAEAFFV